MNTSKKKLPTTGYRGTRDFYPEDMWLRRWIFDRMRQAALAFGYLEYDGPMLEMFELYAAKSGEELVNEQLYHFHDRGERHVAIRPEMTPTVARMVAARVSELVFPVRWFALPNLWRYEKPQRGRLREHWQFNVDIFGVDSVTADFEILQVAIQIMLNLGSQPSDFLIRISNRKLLNHFLSEFLMLDDKGRQAVCRTVDKRFKVPAEIFRQMLSSDGLDIEKTDSLQNFISLEWPGLKTHPVFDSPGGRELQQLFNLLEGSGQTDLCVLDLSIVRGLDYYTGTVFEMYDQSPQNRRALFGGGRYDDLIALFSEKRVSGVGFGMGDVTIQDFVQTHHLGPELNTGIHAMVALFDGSLIHESLKLATLIRSAGFRTIVQLEPAKLGKQYKMADQLNIPVVLLRGPDEIQKGLVSIKHMKSGSQAVVDLNDVIAELKKWIIPEACGGNFYK